MRMTRDSAQSTCVINVPKQLKISHAQRSAADTQGHRRFIGGGSLRGIIVIQRLKEWLAVERDHEPVIDDRSLQQDSKRPALGLGQRSGPGYHKLLAIVPSYI